VHQHELQILDSLINILLLVRLTETRMKHAAYPQASMTRPDTTGTTTRLLKILHLHRAMLCSREMIVVVQHRCDRYFAIHRDIIELN
jgi:hypothetical protein